MDLTRYKLVYPPKMIILGGGRFCWEDPLGSSDDPNIIVGCLKVVNALSNFFISPPAGFRTLPAGQKGVDCPKTAKNRLFSTKFGRGSGGFIFACSFDFENLNHNVLWAQKILYDVPAASGYIWEAQKRKIFSKIAKIGENT